MKKEELLDLITISQAAKLRGVTIEAILDLIKRGRLNPVSIAGRNHLRRSEVVSFVPSKGGRPSKQSSKAKSKGKK